MGRPRSDRRSLSFVAGVAFVSLTGCGTPFDGRVYHGDDYAFRIAPAPASWKPMAADGAAIVYADAESNGTILVNARCDRDAEDTPLRSLTQHLFLRFTERQIHSEEVRPFDGREALRTDITAKLDGVEQRFLVWVLKKDRCVYDLVFFASPPTFERTAAQFEAWVSGFSALPRQNGKVLER
ncbi:MAG: hypothetical protein U0271_31265 [Polyangiaceae bacterium]